MIKFLPRAYVLTVFAFLCVKCLAPSRSKQKMNDLLARHSAQNNMLYNLMRSHSTLWRATQVTREKLDKRFILSEFARVNGTRTVHVLIPASSTHLRRRTHWDSLNDNLSWAESMRALAVRQQTPMTSRFGDIGQMRETVTETKVVASLQSSALEHIARIEGITISPKEQ